MNDVEELTTLVRLRAGAAAGEGGMCVRVGERSGMPQPHISPCLPRQLRSAAEYEERKLIRAAIRRVRAQEIEGVCGLAFPLCPPPATSWRPLTCYFLLDFQLPPWLGGCAAGVSTRAHEKTVRAGRHAGWSGGR